jgi:chromosome segregation ATPase
VNRVLSPPRIGVLLAGVLVGAFAVRKNRVPAAPSWRTEIEELERKLRSWCTTSDVRVAELHRRVDGAEESLRTTGGSSQAGALDATNPEAQQTATLLALAAHERRLAALEEAKPWLGAIQELKAGLGSRLESHESATTSHLTAHRDRLAGLEQQMNDVASSFARVHDVTAGFDTHAGRIQTLERKVEEHQRKLDTAAAIAAEVEKTARCGMLQLEEQLNTQAQLLDTLSAAATHTAGELKRLTESVELLFRPAPPTSEVLPLPVTQIGSLSSVIDEDVALARIFDLRL